MCEDQNHVSVHPGTIFTFESKLIILRHADFLAQILVSDTSTGHMAGGSTKGTEVIVPCYFPILADRLRSIPTGRLWHAELLRINVTFDLSVPNSGMHGIYDDISGYYYYSDGI